MGFPDERDTSMENTPRRSRRARETTRNPFEPATPGGAESGGGFGATQPGGFGAPPSGFGATQPGGFGPPATPSSGRDPFEAAGSGGAKGGKPEKSGRRGKPDQAGGDQPEAGGRRSRSRKGNDEATPEQGADQPAVRRSTTWSPYDEESRSRGPLIFTIGGAAILALLAGGLVWMFKSGGADQATQSQSADRTSAPLPTAPPGKYSYATDRKTDPDPLTVKELFGAKKVTVSGRSYTMTITSKVKKCSDGVVGEKITKALKSGKCTQVVRASFRDKDGKVFGTIGVANLSSSKNATKVSKAGSKTDYVKPLPGKDSVTKTLGTGTGGTQISTHGHYAVMIWFGNKDGTKPDKKGQAKLTQAMDDVTKATIYKALDTRTLTGHPGV
ncbi:hypothetical protein [Nonomuraea rhizosphaerae]|uniref:hypothetical protein n=1 Tax=Nonomuraea rhizosphaerae TaxID=2665663 RepID=UPI001C5D07E6|nr:hypothetical protein [Nonomuraea rhizosphaerae]